VVGAAAVATAAVVPYPRKLTNIVPTQAHTVSRSKRPASSRAGVGHYGPLVTRMISALRPSLIAIRPEGGGFGPHDRHRLPAATWLDRGRAVGQANRVRDRDVLGTASLVYGCSAATRIRGSPSWHGGGLSPLPSDADVATPGSCHRRLPVRSGVAEAGTIVRRRLSRGQQGGECQPPSAVGAGCPTPSRPTCPSVRRLGWSFC